jgi:hypothetical protein
MLCSRLNRDGCQRLGELAFPCHLPGWTVGDNILTTHSFRRFSAFQAVSAYTGGGLSLVDQGMVPFVNGKTLVVFLGALIGAGNMLMVSTSTLSISNVTFNSASASLSASHYVRINSSFSINRNILTMISRWGVYHLLPKNNADRPYWRFLLDHPRRYIFAF